MSERFLRLRRVGMVAAACAATLGTTAVAEGTATAAPLSVAAALPAGSTPTTIAGSTPAGGAVAAPIDVTLSGGTISQNDTITLALPCTPTLAFGSNSRASANWSVAEAPVPGSGCSVDNELQVSAQAAAVSSTNASTIVTVTPAYAANGTSPGPVDLTGHYLALGSTTNVTVPSDATVSWFSTTSDVPAVTVANDAVAQVVSPLQIDQPGAFTVGPTLSGATVTVSLVGTNATFAMSPGAVVTAAGMTPPSALSIAPTAVTFTAGTLPPVSGAGAQITISGLQVVPVKGAPPGPVMAKITANGTTIGNVTLATVLANANRIDGPAGTPDSTVAQEFLTAFPTGKAVAVLATNADPFDALAASYLEGQLGTGLLLTPPTKLGASALAVMKQEGVQTVYVVGGPLAIAPSVVAQLEATPSYHAGGVSETGSNIKVVGPIYGATAVDTARAISTYFGSATLGEPDVPGAYSPVTSPSPNGLYNDTAGIASHSAPPAAAPTAFVISASDWQDAMTLAPMAYVDHIPVLLTSATSLSPQTATALTTLGVKQVIVVGGPLALADGVVSSIAALNGGISVLRVAGQVASDTAAQLANFELAAAPTGLGWGSSSTAVLVSHADYWSDALGAAALGGESIAINGAGAYGNEPVLLVDSPASAGSYVGPELSKLAIAYPRIQTLNILGGPLAVPPTMVDTLEASLATR